jgi:hypothetical protein
VGQEELKEREREREIRMRHRISLVPPLRMGPVEEAEAPMLTQLTKEQGKSSACDTGVLFAEDLRTC